MTLLTQPPLEGKRPHLSESLPPDLAAIDPRLSLLARASARLLLVEAGELDLTDAFNGLIASFQELVVGGYA